MIAIPFVAPFVVPGFVAASLLLQEPSTAPLDAGALKSEIDVSLRWLRSRQDAQTGGYGSVLETLAVLDALSGSPRAYRSSDGPFVADAVDFLVERQRDDGAICQPGATAEEARAQTRRALLLLERLGASPDAIARAAAFLGETEPWPDDPWASHWPDRPRAAVARHATLTLAARDEAGAWHGEGGEVLRTAESIRVLSSIYRYLKANEPPAAPREAHALPSFDAADRERATAALARGARFLLEQADGGRWGFAGRPDPGITAMVTGALLAVPEPRSEELRKAIDAALDWLVSLQKSDGSIHAGQLANYVTSASVMALVRAGRPGDAEAIARAREFLRILQADEGEGYAPGDRFYGGVGYGGDERPDLSNLQMALEALHDAGVATGDETYGKALAFLQRCQNRSESNDFSVEVDGVTVVSGNDGGAGYAPGDSKAGFVELADGRRVPRSYGSMTYALLKGYLFAGLSKDDPRVVAAWEWLRRHYTLDVNPGFEASDDPTAAYQGLFYYFTTMAKALDLYGDEVVVDAAGVEHAWRAELAGRLVSMQRPDGSWVNDNAPRWYEGNPVLATAYAMITLGIAL